MLFVQSDVVLINLFMDDYVWIAAIVCFTIYQVMALRSRPTRRNRYEDLKTLHELCEKGAITKQEFETKKEEILNWEDDT